MGWRFRKSINLGGGTWLNLGSKSWGISAGRKGFRVSSNTRTGSHVTTSIPGTGISHRQKIAGSNNGPDSDVVATVGGCMVLWGLISPGSCAIFVLVLLFGGFLLVKWTVGIVATALLIAWAIVVGLLPLILSGALAFLIAFSRFFEGDGRKLVAGGVAATGICANFLFLALAPQFYPPLNIERIMARGQIPPSSLKQENPLTATATPVPVAAEASPAGMAPALKLIVERSYYAIRRLRRQRLSSAMVRQSQAVAIPDSMKPDIRVVEWTVTLRNAGTQEITALSYGITFLQADGTPVKREEGFAQKAAQDRRYNCALVSSGKVALRLKPGEARTFMLAELVSADAAAQIKKATITWAGETVSSR